MLKLPATGMLPLAVCLLPLSAVAESLKLAVTYGKEGPASIVWNGVEMLAERPFTAEFRFAGDPRGSHAKPIKVEGAGARVVRTYEGATVCLVYGQRGDRVQVTVEIRNDSDKALEQARIVPLKIQFPRRPEGGSWRWGYATISDGEGEPTVIIADWGDGKLAACKDHPDRPVTFGFNGNYRQGTANEMVIQTLGDKLFDPHEIPSGGSLELSFSLRFGGPTATPETLAGDVYDAYAKAYPRTIQWADNRPVGALFLARSNTGWKNNPRGYFNDERLDITTLVGREEFRARLMKFADVSIKTIQETNGQGMIVWDIEGAEMPHAITYLGDPRILPHVAPEMDPLADAFFQKFRDAGLKTGVCLRPTKIVFADKEKYPWIKTRYGHENNVDPVENICDKIAYARRRWGCTLFYLDTPGLYLRRGDQARYYQLPPRVMRAIHRRHPDVLIMPEFGPTAYYAVGSKYHEFGGHYQTPAAVKAVYPKAFSLFALKDDPLYPHWDQVVEGVQGGDLLLFRGWFGDHRNTRVRQAWMEAEFKNKPVSDRVAAAGKNVQTLVESLRDDDPVVRFQTAVALGERKAGAAALALAAQRDEVWNVRRAAVEALGGIGGQPAIAALSKTLADSQSDLRYFAATAMGDIGAAAIPALMRALEGNDAAQWEAVAAGLGRIDSPMVVPVMERVLREESPHAYAAQMEVLASLHRNPRPQLLNAVAALLADGPGGRRTKAAETLGAFKDERAIEPLIQLLEKTDGDLYYAKKAAMFALEDITGYDGAEPGKGGGGESAEKWRKILERK